MTTVKDQIGGGGLLSPALERWRNGKVAAFIPDGSRVLDLGCGRAGLLRALHAKRKRAVEYVGMDRAAAVIEADRADFPDQTFVACDLTRGVDDANGSFDAITLIALVEHLENPELLLGSFRSRLRPDGRFLITTPRRGGERIYAAGVSLGLFSRAAHEEHNERFPDRDFLMRLAERGGCVPERLELFMFGFNQLAILRPA